MNALKWESFVYLITIAVHVYCKEPNAILLTQNKLEYTFFPFPLNVTVVKFKVRAPHDAHLLLSAEPKDENPTYEIFVGGWMNTKSAVRFNHTRPDVAVANTKGILSGGALRGFWLNCSQGFVGIGREGELIPFLNWTNPSPFKVQFLGVRTGWGATGEWIMDDVTYARIDLYDFRIGQPAIVSVDVLSKTPPFLIWKVHNKTFSEGNFDQTGRLHATKALFKREGEWQAKLIINTVTLEDTQEEILLTARNQSKLGAKSYHVFIYPFNASSNYSDVISGNEATESSAVDSSSLTDDPIVCYTVSTLDGSSVSNTNSNNITQTILQEENTSTTPMEILLRTPKITERTAIQLSTTPMEILLRTPKITERTAIQLSTTPMEILLRTPKITERTATIQLSTTSSLRTSPSIGSTRTTPKTIRTVTISNNNQTKTIKVSRSTTQANTEPNNNTLSTSKPKETPEYISYNTTYPNNISQTSTKPMNFISGTKQYTTQKSSTNMFKSMLVTKVPTTATTRDDRPSRKLQCFDHVSGAEQITIGVLVLVLVLMTALVGYIMIKHKRMTGQWGFTAKCQTEIPMGNLYDDDNSCCLIQQPESILT